MENNGHLTEILIILIAAVLSVPIFQRLRLSPILGYLYAGIVIGPFGLGLINDVAEVKHLAEFGVVFLLFIIGLELSIERIKAAQRLVLGLGTTQILVTGTIVAAVAYLAFDFSRDTAIVIGCALSLSSTAMVLRLLADRHELVARHGRASFAVLLMQDIAVVPILTFLPLLANPEASILAAVGGALVRAILALAVIVLLGRYLLRPLFRTVAAGRTPELFTGLILLAVLGVGWITAMADLSMALGAFLAGLLLSETEFRHQIEADIQPFYGLLLALFFMSVGMLIDIEFVLAHLAPILGLVAALMVGKVVILYPLCRLWGLSQGVSLRVALSLAQGGEFAFVVVNFAAGRALFPEEATAFLFPVVAISMALTPGLLWLGRQAETWLSGRAKITAEQMDAELSEIEGHVLICGFGRVGQILAQLLESFRISYVALDLDPARVSEGRARGLHVYYGDASRPDVLRSAGAREARAAVITLDHPVASERTVNTLHRQYPELPIIVRARDPIHSAELERVGTVEAIPELLEGSLRLGSTVLKRIGRPAEEVDSLLDQLRREDYRKLMDLLPRSLPDKAAEKYRAPKSPPRHQPPS